MDTRYYAFVGSDEEYSAIRKRLRRLPLSRSHYLLSISYLKEIDQWSGHSPLNAVDVSVSLNDVVLHLCSKGTQAGTPSDLGIIAWNKGRVCDGHPIIPESDCRRLLRA